LSDNNVIQLKKPVGYKSSLYYLYCCHRTSHITSSAKNHWGTRPWKK